ncbi:TadE/TadG family type IV pilus assembly protein [Propioniciclava soli]|uniref:TadE/TadG family type IV pilus assembly protein n=1 Tax=Propioniciclava soli TaxID=2775081 RepID=A0ABZ3C812_9ACTN|nr:TadE/TadG family type IV pilus assembly protein [Propioniciclava soli]
MTDSVQWAILTPLLLLTVLGIIQAGLWLHGRTIASSAAIAGAEEAAVLGATDSAAVAMAERLADGGGLADVTVSVERSTERVRVVVSGQMPTFVDLGQTRVSEQATRPVERVTRP